MKLASIVAPPLILIATASCSPQGGGGPASLRIGMIPKLENIPYFKACERGAREAAAELGVELVYRGPSNNRVEDQIPIVEDMIQLGLDVIAVAPNDPEAIAPVLKKARDKGIVVVTWDADANPKASGRNAFCNQTPTDELAYTLVDIVAEAIGGRGKAVIVSSTPTAPNQNAWIRFMEARLKEAYPDVQLLQTLYPDEDVGKARQMTAGVLAAHPDLKGVWGLTSVAVPGAAEAVRQAGKGGRVAVTGVTLPSELREYVKDGTVAKFCLWNPEDLGYLAVYVAKKIRDGDLKDGEQNVGRVGGVRVKGDEVILGAPIVFTKENIDQYNF